MDVAFQHHLIVDGICENLGRAYDDTQFLDPNDACIYEVALQHHEMGHQFHKYAESLTKVKFIVFR